MKKVLIGLLVIILIALGGLGYVYSMATSTDIGEELIGTTTLEPEKVEAIVANIEEIAPDEVIEMKSEEVNAFTNKISEDIKGRAGVEVESINSKVEDGKLKLQIPTTVKGKEVIISAETEIEVKDDKLVIKVDELKTGKLSLPESSVGDKLDELINSDKVKIDGNNISIDIDKLPYDIGDIKVDGDKLIINGQEVKK